MEIKLIPTLPHHRLLQAFAEVVDELDSLYHQQADAQALQNSTRFNAFTSSSATSITQREWEAKIACQTETAELLTIGAEIASLLEVKELINACLNLQAS